MVDVFAGTLGMSDRHGFLECRGLHDKGSGHAFRGIITRAGTEPERVRGEICPIDKGRMFESHDLRESGVTSTRDRSVSDPLSW